MTSVPASTGIAARDVCKSFGDHLVLDKVSLAAEEGTILALLGPNGAGKTTMVRILSTLIPGDSGSMRIAGHDVVTDPDGVRAVIGVTGQFSAVDNLLTGAENLQMIADLRHLGREAGRRRVAELLGSELQSLWGGTFHAIGARLLRRHAEALGYARDFTILDREDANDLIKTCLAEAEIDVKATRFPKADVLAKLLGRDVEISTAVPVAPKPPRKTGRGKVRPAK